MKNILKIKIVIFITLLPFFLNAQSFLPPGPIMGMGRSSTGNLTIKRDSVILWQVSPDGKLRNGSGQTGSGDTAAVEVTSPISFAAFPGSSNPIGIKCVSDDNSGNGTALQAIGGYYAIHGITLDTSLGARAGYFGGIVQAIEYRVGSDIKLKQNIIPLKNSLTDLLKLNPVNYNFKCKDYPQMALPHEKQFGLIAQDIEKIFPDLVKEEVQPAFSTGGVNPKRYEGIRYKSVNYISLIPVIIQAIKEQQKIIETENNNLKNELSRKDEKLNIALIELQELKSRMEKMEKTLSGGNKSEINPGIKSEGQLDQNNPNPFSKTTSIRYFVPGQSNKASIKIITADAKVIKSFENISKLNGEIIIDAKSLSAGNYFYQLIIDDKIIDCKKMTLTVN